MVRIDPVVRKHIEQEEFPQAIDILLPQAEAGDADAQFLLGYLHFTSAEIDPKQAKEWLRQAAARNHAEACYYLALWLEDHRTGMPSDPEGRALFHRASESGSSEAQSALGSCYGAGWDDFPVDGVLSRTWYRRAAEQEDVDAQYNLGMMLLHGEGGEVDYPQGLDWLARAASQNLKEAMSEFAAEILADIYEHGHYGVEPDKEAAEHWRQRKAELEQIDFPSHPAWFYEGTGRNAVINSLKPSIETGEE